MLQTSNSDQPAQTASLMRVVIVGKTISGRWEINLAEGNHFEQSARIRRSVRLFAVATFQETLINCLFFNENKAYVYDENAILTPDADYITTQTPQTNRSGSCCEILMSVPVYSDCAVYICNLVSGHVQFS